MAALAAGHLAALPTETVYGLGALVDHPDAVSRIFAVKGRPADHPLIVHVSGSAALSNWAQEVPPTAVALCAAYWPGPLTLVLPRSASVPDSVTGGQDTVALRAPAHPVFATVLEQLDLLMARPVGVAAPSANRFGQVSPTTAQHVERELGDRLVSGQDVIVDGGPCRVGVESTIVIWQFGDRWRIAREGAVTREQLREIVDVAQADQQPIRVPGTHASHYSPAARVLVVDSLDAVEPSTLPTKVGLLAPAAVNTPAGWHRLAAPADSEQYAQILYAALRAADLAGLPIVVAVRPSAAGIGAAVRDRLQRAGS